VNNLDAAIKLIKEKLDSANKKAAPPINFEELEHLLDLLLKTKLDLRATQYKSYRMERGDEL
jgi:hypothetical protein